MSELPDFDCSKFVGRLRSICEGTSGLPKEMEESYRRLWANMPPAAPPDFSCRNRGSLIRQEQCKICGGRELIVDVLECSVHSECTIHAHGLRNEKGKLAVCIACEDRQCAI